MNTEPDQREPRGAAELSEDVTGFGVAELRTLKDLVLRPHTVLEAWMQAGPTGGGLYARPLRLYLALCGFMTLILFVKGGDTQISALPPEVLQSLADQAGKSVDAFVADAENWYSVALIPVSCAFYALVSIPLLRWWDPEDLGWRRGLRATFGYLNAWTVPVVPVTWWANEQSAVGGFIALLMFVMALVTFIRMGRGRWFRTWFGGVTKGLTLTVLLFVMAVVAIIPLFALAYIGGTYTR